MTETMRQLMLVLLRGKKDEDHVFTREDGSPIVDPYFRPQWPPNFQIFGLTVVSGQACKNLE